MTTDIIIITNIIITIMTNIIIVVITDINIVVMRVVVDNTVVERELKGSNFRLRPPIAIDQWKLLVCGCS